MHAEALKTRRFDSDDNLRNDLDQTILSFKKKFGVKTMTFHFQKSPYGRHVVKIRLKSGLKMFQEEGEGSSVQMALVTARARMENRLSGEAEVQALNNMTSIKERRRMAELELV